MAEEWIRYNHIRLSNCVYYDRIYTMYRQDDTENHSIVVTSFRFSNVARSKSHQLIVAQRSETDRATHIHACDTVRAVCGHSDLKFSKLDER